VDLLVGDCSKAKEKLGWSHSTGFEALVEEMVTSDLKLFSSKSKKDIKINL